MSRGEIKALVAKLDRECAQLEARVVQLCADMGRLKAALNGASNGLEVLEDDTCFATAYRRAHRPGRPSRIDTDAELRTFILDRIDTSTFEAPEAAVAAHFPPERRVKRSTINDWWHKNGTPSAKTHPR